MTNEELLALFRDLESDRVERKSSPSDRDKIKQAICAFANDLPNHNMPGVLFVGVDDKGDCANLTITDDLLLKLSNIRGEGNITPLPSMTVNKKTLDGCDVIVIVVTPSDAPPVRFRGKTWIRIGPRRDLASREEERRLSEKRRGKDLPFDLRPIVSAALDDLNLQLFTAEYLPSSIDSETIERNSRSKEEQLTSLRFLSSLDEGSPTVVGMLAIGIDPRAFVHGAYVQFVRFDGTELTHPIRDQKEIGGPLSQMLRMMDEVFEANISVATDITSGTIESRYPDYPIAAIQQIARNAVLHRNYEGTNAPVRIYWFNDRIEISNPGGPFGQVSVATFGAPGVTDYRNPHIAEVMKNLGFVQKFGVGLQIAREEMRKNGNPEIELKPENEYTLVILRRKT